MKGNKIIQNGGPIFIMNINTNSQQYVRKWNSPINIKNNESYSCPGNTSFVQLWKNLIHLIYRIFTIYIYIYIHVYIYIYVYIHIYI